MNKIKEFLFENKSIRQTVLKNTIWLTVGTVASRLIRAILIIYAARILGTEGYGVFSYALGVAAFFTIFSDIGLSALLTRETVRNSDPEKKSEYLSTTFWIKFVLLAITVLITIFAAPHFTKIIEAKPLIPIIALLLAFDSLRGFGFSITRAQNRMEFEAGLNIVTDLFITMFGLFVLFTKPTTIALTYAYILGSGIGFVLIFIALRHQLKGIFSKFNKNLIKPILSTAWPFAIMGLLGGFMINIDIIILGIFRSAYDLGLYAVAQRPVQFLYIIPAILATSLFPIMSKLVHDNGLTKLKELLEKSIAIVMAIAIPITVGGIILGKQLINFVFGQGYSDATFTFQLLLITILLIFPGTIIGNAVFAYNRQKIFITSTSFGAIANVILDFILIPIYGIAGSAVATIVSQIFTNGINWREMKKINNFKTIRYLGRTFIATIIMAIFVIVMNSWGLHIIPNIILSAIIYIGALILLKEPLLDFVKTSGLIK